MKTKLLTLAVALIVLGFLMGFARSSANAVDGKWTAKVITKSMRRPKQFSSITLDLHANGNKLEGTARAEKLTGEAIITDGRIEGETIAFRTVFNESTSTSGVPELAFTGTIHGNEIKLDVNWHYSGWGNTTYNDMPLEMEGARLTQE